MKINVLTTKSEAIEAYIKSKDNRSNACTYFGNNAFIKEAKNADELKKTCEMYITSYNDCIKNLKLLSDGASDWEAKRKETEISEILRGITDPELKAKYKSLLD